MEEYIEYQPLINIGCLGCVSDGKSTLIKCLTGTKTQRHSHEKNKNLSIKQGYANLKIYENEKLINHISFVDCPGHQDLILTLLTSSTAGIKKPKVRTQVHAISVVKPDRQL